MKSSKSKYNVMQIGTQKPNFKYRLIQFEVAETKRKKMLESQ